MLVTKCVYALMQASTLIQDVATIPLDTLEAASYKGAQVANADVSQLMESNPDQSPLPQIACLASHMYM